MNFGGFEENFVKKKVSKSVLGEMGLVLLLIFLFHGLHVLGDVAAEDAVGEGGGVEIGVGALLLGGFVAGETLAVVGDVETAISGALHGGENFGANGGADETDVKKGLFSLFYKTKNDKMGLG